MKLMRVGPVGAEIPVVMGAAGDTFGSGVAADSDGAFFAGGGLDRLAAAGRLSALDSAGRRIGAPIAWPGAVLCIVMNYAAPAAETGATPPEVPILFDQSPNPAIGPDDERLIPRGLATTDWEVELDVVIGATARDEVGELQSLRLSSWVKGEPRQDSSTAEMISDVAEIIYQLSQVLGPA